MSYALWPGTPQYVSKRVFNEEISSINGELGLLSTPYATISTLPLFVSTLVVNDLRFSSATGYYASISTANIANQNSYQISSVYGDFGAIHSQYIFNKYDITTNFASISTANIGNLNASNPGSIDGVLFSSASLVASSIRAVTGDFDFTRVSTVQFQPSLGGVSLGGVNLGMGGFLGGLVGGLGSGILNTIIGGTALATGIAALVNTRQNTPAAPNINSNAYELINGTTQLQVSTLGQDVVSIFRTVSSINPNTTPGLEIFTSTIITAGTVAIRSISDPMNLANSNIAASSIQAFGQWADLLPSPDQQDFSNIRINYKNSPGLFISTGQAYQSSFNYTYPTSFSFSTLNTNSEPILITNGSFQLANFISSSYNPSISTLGLTTYLNQANFTDLHPPSSFQYFKFPQGPISSYMNMSTITAGNTYTFDVDTIGSGTLSLSLPPTVAAPTGNLINIPSGIRDRVSFQGYSVGVPSVIPFPDPVSTVVSTFTANQTMINNTSNQTILTVSTNAQGRGSNGFAINALPVVIGFNDAYGLYQFPIQLNESTVVNGPLKVASYVQAPGIGNALVDGFGSATGTSVTFNTQGVDLDCSFFDTGGFSFSAPNISTTDLYVFSNAQYYKTMDWQLSSATSFLTILDSKVTLPNNTLITNLSTVNTDVTKLTVKSLSTINADITQLTVKSSSTINADVTYLTVDQILRQNGTQSFFAGTSYFNTIVANTIAGTANAFSSITVGLNSYPQYINIDHQNLTFIDNASGENGFVSYASSPTLAVTMGVKLANTIPAYVATSPGGIALVTTGPLIHMIAPSLLIDAPPTINYQTTFNSTITVAGQAQFNSLVNMTAGLGVGGQATFSNAIYVKDTLYNPIAIHGNPTPNILQTFMSAAGRNTLVATSAPLALGTSGSICAYTFTGQWATQNAVRVTLTGNSSGTYAVADLPFGVNNYYTLYIVNSYGGTPNVVFCVIQGDKGAPTPGTFLAIDSSETISYVCTSLINGGGNYLFPNQSASFNQAPYPWPISFVLNPQITPTFSIWANLNNGSANIDLSAFVINIKLEAII